MNTLKQEALTAITQLPETADVEYDYVQALCDR